MGTLGPSKDFSLGLGSERLLLPRFLFALLWELWTSWTLAGVHGPPACCMPLLTPVTGTLTPLGAGKYLEQLEQCQWCGGDKIVWRAFQERDVLELSSLAFWDSCYQNVSAWQLKIWSAWSQRMEIWRLPGSTPYSAHWQRDLQDITQPVYTWESTVRWGW